MFVEKKNSVLNKINHGLISKCLVSSSQFSNWKGRNYFLKVSIYYTNKTSSLPRNHCFVQQYNSHGMNHIMKILD